MIDRNDVTAIRAVHLNLICSEHFLNLEWEWTFSWNWVSKFAGAVPLVLCVAAGCSVGLAHDGCHFAQVTLLRPPRPPHRTDSLLCCVLLFLRGPSPAIRLHQPVGQFFRIESFIFPKY